MATDVADAPTRSRYEVTVDGELAGFAQYRDVEGRRVFTHTEVFDAFEGKGVGSALAAGALDHAHIVVVPILLGRGVRLWDGLEGLEKDYQVEATSSPSGVTHVMFTRTAL